MWSIELIIIIFSIMLLLSVLLSKVSERFGVPSLLVFLALGMLAGSDGPGGIYFDNAWVSQAFGTVALAYILFTGGLETDAQSIRKVFRPALSLATVGVLLTAFITGACVKFALNLSWLEGFLIGSIVSSTDAAAVLSVLRSKSVGLKQPLRPLLELESGSNDPMAVFLTVGFIELIRNPGQSVWTLIPLFFQQMIFGALVGFVFAKIFVFLINRIKLDYEGLYPVLCLGWVLLTFSTATVFKGSGFLAVYVTGLYLNNNAFVHKKSLIRFHDGIAWLMQIVMFATLGLLVFPSQLIQVVGPGLLVAFILVFIARPISIFLSVPFMGFSLREKLLLSWVGLRGSVPIVLATFPFVAGFDQDHFIFNLVFFVVLTSVLLQGTTIPWVAKFLGVDAPLIRQKRYPIEFDESENSDLRLVDLILPYGSRMAGQPILKMGLPKSSLITMVVRDDRYVMPTGDTVLEEGDVLLVLGSPDTIKTVQNIIRVENKK